MSDFQRNRLELTSDDEDRLPWLEPVDDYDDEEGISIARLIGAVVVGLVALGLVIGGIFWLRNREASGDGRRRGQAGFRLDGGEAESGAWLVKADLFQSRDSFPDRESGEFTGLALQGRWSHALAPESMLTLHSYYRREHRRVPQQLTHSVDTVDADLQHAFTWRTRHQIVWGGGARLNHDNTEPGTVAFEPKGRTYSVISAFAQDEIVLRPNRLYVTAGLKMERNAFSGAEWQPNVRVRAQLTPRQMLWAAVSRAARRPTRLDVDVRAFTPAGEVVAVGGGEGYKAETLTAVELGYRIQPAPIVTLDDTVYTHRYNDLRTQE